MSGLERSGNRRDRGAYREDITGLYHGILIQFIESKFSADALTLGSGDHNNGFI